jgi:hypothetical protein
MHGYTVVQHPNGQIYYVKSDNATETRYRIFIRLGQRAAGLSCNEPPNAGTGPGACLTIAQTARFEAPNTNPTAIPHECLRQKVSGRETEIGASEEPGHVHGRPNSAKRQASGSILQRD